MRVCKCRKEMSFVYIYYFGKKLLRTILSAQTVFENLCATGQFVTSF